MNLTVSSPPGFGAGKLEIIRDKLDELENLDPIHPLVYIDPMINEQNGGLQREHTSILGSREVVASPLHPVVGDEIIEHQCAWGKRGSGDLDYEGEQSINITNPQCKIVEYDGEKKGEQNSEDFEQQNIVCLQESLDTGEDQMSMMVDDDIHVDKVTKNMSRDMGVVEYDKNNIKSDDKEELEPLLIDVLGRPIAFDVGVWYDPVVVDETSG